MSKQKLTDEQILLAEENQIESKKFFQEVEKIENVKKQLLKKKITANQEIDKLKKQLAELDKEYLFETDPAKIKELAEKKKDIRYEIEEYESIKATKYNPIIKDMLKGIEQHRDNAAKENDMFHTSRIALEKQYREEWDAYNKAMQEKLDNLDSLQYSHTFNQAYTKYTGIKTDKGDW